MSESQTEEQTDEQTETEEETVEPLHASFFSRVGDLVDMAPDSVSLRDGVDETHRILNVDLGVFHVLVHIHVDEGSPRLGDETATLVWRVKSFGAVVARDSWTAKSEWVLDWLKGLID